MPDRPVFFVDRSLGKSVGLRLREAGARAELHDDHFAQTTPDAEWIPNVAARGWVILTKDKNIRRPRGEREHVLTARARVFTLTSGNMSGQRMADLFIQHLAEIEQIAAAQAPPFAYAVGPEKLFQIIGPHAPVPPSPETRDQAPESAQGDSSAPRLVLAPDTPVGERGENRPGL